MIRKRKNIVKQLDTIFSLYIRHKYSKNGLCECFTCGRQYPIKKIQNGHFMSRGSYSTRWSEDNCRPQCYGCNVMQQGKQYEFAIKLGKDKANKMLRLSKQIVKFSNDDLLEKIRYYQKKISNFKL